MSLFLLFWKMSLFIFFCDILKMYKDFIRKMHWFDKIVLRMSKSQLRFDEVSSWIIIYRYKMIKYCVVRVGMWLLGRYRYKLYRFCAKIAPFWSIKNVTFFLKNVTKKKVTFWKKSDKKKWHWFLKKTLCLIPLMFPSCVHLAFFFAGLAGTANRRRVCFSSTECVTYD